MFEFFRQEVFSLLDYNCQKQLHALSMLRRYAGEKGQGKPKREGEKGKAKSAKKGNAKGEGEPDKGALGTWALGNMMQQPQQQQIAAANAAPLSDAAAYSSSYSRLDCFSLR